MKSSITGTAVNTAIDMKKPIIKVITILLLCEILFVLVFKFLLALIPHESHEFIYYFNINFLYLISLVIWFTYPLSKIDNYLVILIGCWFTILTPYSIFFIFSQPNFSDVFNYINFHVLYTFSTSYQLIITLYIFILSLVPHFRKIKILIIAVSIGILIGILNYIPIYFSGDYRLSWDPLFSRSYNMHILN